MDSIVALLGALNGVSSLGLAVLLGLVLFFQAKNKKDVDAIAHNHLSGLPEITETLQRMERTLAALDSYLRARLNHIDRE